MNNSIVKTISLEKGLYRVSVVEESQQTPAGESGATASLIVIPIPSGQTVAATFLSATRDFAMLTAEDSRRILQVNLASVDFHIVSLVQDGAEPLDLKVVPLLLGDDAHQALFEKLADPKLATQTLLTPLPEKLSGDQLLMHLSGVGDVRISAENDLVSKYGGPAAEGFSFHFDDSVAEGESFEYKALALNGAETPWIKNGKFCGSRGHRLPLVGIAIRPLSTKLQVEYQVRFVSGATSSVVRNGTPLRSQKPSDPITQITMKVIAVQDMPATARAPLRTAPAASKKLADKKPLTGKKAVPKSKKK